MSKENYFWKILFWWEILWKYDFRKTGRLNDFRKRLEHQHFLPRHSVLYHHTRVQGCIWRFLRSNFCKFRLRWGTKIWSEEKVEMFRQSCSRNVRWGKAELSECYLVEERRYTSELSECNLTSTDTCPFENSNEREIVSVSEHYLFGKASLLR